MPAASLLAFRGTQYRIDGLLFGVLLAHLSHFAPAKWARLTRHRRALVGCAVAGVVLTLLGRGDRQYVRSVGYTLLYLGYGGLLVAAVGTPVEQSRLLSSAAARWLARLGYYSYSVYLWHFRAAVLPLAPLRRALGGLPPDLGWLVAQAVVVTVSVVVGVSLGRLIELPVLRLRDAWFPPRAKPVLPGTVAGGQT